MKVYIDAVFNPLLISQKLIFMQEGHHLHLENDMVTHTGVVLNEMRGMYGDAGYLGRRAIIEALFKGGSMEHNSGGNPDEIEKLTYEEVVQYFEKHYTTKNCTIVLINGYSIVKQLEIID